MKAKNWAFDVLSIHLLSSTLQVSALTEPPRLQYGSQHILAAKSGAVASESRVCSQVGIDLLAAGGNAVDAFVGTQLCVGVIGMHHSGLGGGGFALIRSSEGKYTVIDYREAAPAAAFQDMYKDNVAGSIFGGLAAGIPGELRGLESAHRLYGSLPWRDVVCPAAYVARHGFPVTEDMIRYMKEGIDYAKWNFLVEDPSWALDFAPNGTLLRLGDTMTRKRYADTLDAVAEGGADVFYMGSMANTTIAIVQDTNGTMTLQDMASYRAIIREPVSITYRGYKLFSSGAPSSGAVALSILKTMEQYSSADSSDTNLTFHRFDEAMRFAYAAHQQLGDPDYEESIDILEANMLSTRGAAATRKLIHDNSTQPVENYFGKPYYTPESHGTSHVVTTDNDGMAVSSTTTVNLLFGNLIMVNETGVILNNEMNDFSIPNIRNEFGYAPSPINFIRPGKRPLSSISPIIVEKPTGQLFVVVGAAGGSRITSATTQVTWRILEYKMGMYEAIKEPRFHDQLIPDQTAFEWTFDNSTISSLREKGHNITWWKNAQSSVQGIRTDRGVFEAVGETRQINSAGLTLGNA